MAWGCFNWAWSAATLTDFIRLASHWLQKAPDQRPLSSAAGSVEGRTRHQSSFLCPMSFSLAWAAWNYRWGPRLGPQLMNAVKCSVMTGQHDRSFFFHTVESLSVHDHDNGDRNTSEQFLRDTLRKNLILNAIFFYLCICRISYLNLWMGCFSISVHGWWINKKDFRDIQGAFFKVLIDYFTHSLK